ncbi:MAG: hypothetical protein H0U74_10195 [Bradymonadaceae bacterium]|nr:hypothetical protein [Lujinxingiaceae bacterium]
MASSNSSSSERCNNNSQVEVSMLQWWWIVIALATVAVAIRFVRPGGAATNSLARALVQARATGEVAGLVIAIESSPLATRATLWDQTIGSLWGEYAREAATQLILEAAQRSDAAIVQYWMRRVIEVEPELAEEHFSEEFLAEHFRPEIAAACGRCGCR